MINNIAWFFIKLSALLAFLTWIIGSLLYLLSKFKLNSNLDDNITTGVEISFVLCLCLAILGIYFHVWDIAFFNIGENFFGISQQVKVVDVDHIDKEYNDDDTYYTIYYNTVGLEDNNDYVYVECSYDKNSILESGTLLSCRTYKDKAVSSNIIVRIFRLLFGLVWCICHIGGIYYIIRFRYKLFSWYKPLVNKIYNKVRKL